MKQAVIIIVALIVVAGASYAIVRSKEQKNLELELLARKSEASQKKAEAKVCMAIAYANMLRYLGGVPILDHAVDPAEEMVYPRNTFKETVDFIVKLCDEAAPDLPWAVSAADDGRMTRAGALGLKLRVQCFAA